MLWRNYGVSHTKSSVWSSCEDTKSLRRIACECEFKLNTFRSSDPVSLHCLNSLWPLKSVNVIKKFFGVVGDLEEPLFKILSLNKVTGAVTRSVSVHLLVSEHCCTTWAPVHWCICAVRESVLVELNKNCLSPLHVFRVMTEYFTAPVVHCAKAVNGILKFLHALVGEDSRVRSCLNGSVFCGKSERVESQRRENCLSEHGLVAN